MYAIVYDLETEKLKNELKTKSSDPYFDVVLEMKQLESEIFHELSELGFNWIQGSFYMNYDEEYDLTIVYKAINKLSKIEWFKKSVRYIRAFKVEDISDFTEIVKS